MAHQSISSQEMEHSSSNAAAELLEALLAHEMPLYPWNVATESTSAYCTTLEEEFNLEDWPESEIRSRSQKLFAQLNSCWAQNAPKKSDVLKVSLSQRFAPRVPKAMLEAIAQKAQEIFHSNLSFGEKLVQSVQHLLPNWAEEDLLVIVRPFAYAMRGETTTVDFALGMVRPLDWNELSPTEQARLTMAIVYYALDQLKQSRDSGL